jgi:hypothetical protein
VNVEDYNYKDINLLVGRNVELLFLQSAFQSQQRFQQITSNWQLE